MIKASANFAFSNRIIFFNEGNLLRICFFFVFLSEVFQLLKISEIEFVTEANIGWPPY